MSAGLVLVAEDDARARDTLRQLLGDVFGDELSLDFRAVDFFDLDVDPAADRDLVPGLHFVSLLFSYHC